MHRWQFGCTARLFTTHKTSDGSLLGLRFGGSEDHVAPCFPDEHKYRAQIVDRDMRLSAEYWDGSPGDVKAFVNDFSKS